MAIAPTYPGVYIEEVPSEVRTITGVATSITAFVGFARRGAVNDPTIVQSFPEFQRTFGGLWNKSSLSFAVQQYFLNGGRDALIVRVARLAGANQARKSKLTIGTGNAQLKLESANEGEWGNHLRVRIDYDTSDKDDPTPRLFNLLVKDMATGEIEALRNLDPAPGLKEIVEQQSRLIRAVDPALPTTRPPDNTAISAGDDPFATAASTAFPDTGAQSGVDGDQANADLVPGTPDGTGIYALDRADIFNLLCVPPVDRAGVLTPGQRASASAYCQEHRALHIVDPHPDWAAPSDLTGSGANNLTNFTTGMGRENAALYFPRVKMADPLRDGATDTFPPAAVVAGIMARTDAARGVWKAPAGQDTTLTGVQDLSVKLTDGENGQLNPLGVNCLRTFPVVGQVVWGARTLAGADRLGSEWKYVPVRRLALFLEESLFRGTQWVVFEPNDESLWAQIRLNLGAFMQNLFRQGAFQGRSPREAYFVKCDGETTTQNDRDLGIVNILVGFAPLKPAEFVIIRIQQIAGQVAA